MGESGAVFWMICIGGGLVGLGALSLAAPDLMWEWTHWSNQWKGLQSERSEGWETSRVLGGVFSILVGVGMICWIISLSSQQAQEEAREAEFEANIAATNAAEIVNLETTFTELIGKWQGDDTEGVHRAAREDIRGLADAVYYGRCDDGYFYAFVIGYQREDYAYVPQGNPETCKPRGLELSFFQSAIAMGDGGWYSVSVFEADPNAIITRTSRPGTPTATPTVTPNATHAQATLDAAIEQQVTAAVATQNSAVTQTIQAAVQATLAAATQNAGD